jgi:hypothetical protein
MRGKGSNRVKIVKVVFGNQFNARPTYGTCGALDVVSTRYGCIDASPIGKGERIVPLRCRYWTAQRGPSHARKQSLQNRPKSEQANGPSGLQASTSVNGRGPGGAQQAAEKLSAANRPSVPWGATNRVIHYLAPRLLLRRVFPQPVKRHPRSMRQFHADTVSRLPLLP